MKKYFIYITVLFISLFSIIPSINAEDKCTSVELNDLMNEASKVTVTIEFVYNNINEVVGFNYLVYNVPNDMYVTYYGIPTEEEEEQEEDYSGEGPVEDPIQILEVDRETGIGKLFDPNLEDSYKVTFTVYKTVSNCNSPLKTINVRKVKYNKFSELEQCKYDGMEDFIYCQKWIDSDFIYGDSVVIDKINKQVEKNKTKTTSICYSCGENEKNNDIYETIVKIRYYSIIGLSIGIVIDLITIVVLFKKVGDYEL